MVLLMLNALQSEGQPSVGDSVRVPGKVLRGSDAGSCPSDQDMIDVANEFFHNISSIINSTHSCGAAGWRRVGYLDMTDPSQSCPSGLALKTYSPGLRSCGRATNGTIGCWSTFYNTGGSQYSRACGRVRGYQFGGTSAFLTAAQGIDSYYVAGVSLTHGQSGSRTHIWTFAAGVAEVYDSPNTPSFCPCITPAAPQPPTFVGNDYFCESGHNAVWDNSQRIFYPDDPLWDGQNCAGNSCCQLNNPPYFTKSLPAPTSDNIELRICLPTNEGSEDVTIDQVELYVQ